MIDNGLRRQKADELAAKGRPRWRRWIFAFVPTLLLFGAAEGAARLFMATSPVLQSVPLPPESAGLFREDPDLFWALRPNLDLEYLGARVRTNSLGLRGPEVGRKGRGEYRILSLGESTTFGSGVADDATYTALVARELGERMSERTVTSINAGVPAYSTFQSLRFIEEQALALEPDMLLVYHELNDYLPSSLRDSSNNEVGLLQTDRERWRSRRGFGFGLVTRHSVLVEYLQGVAARRKIAEFDTTDFDNPLMDIGLPDIGIAPRVAQRAEEAPAIENEAALGRRVSEQERREILLSIARFAVDHGIDLLFIHPAYQASVPHQCVLTHFVNEYGLPMTKAGVSLHAQDVPRGSLYRDAWHPTAEGHARLASQLAHEISLFFPHLGASRD